MQEGGLTWCAEGLDFRILRDSTISLAKMAGTGAEHCPGVRHTRRRRKTWMNMLERKDGRRRDEKE